jgi:hypothetical protein
MCWGAPVLHKLAILHEEGHQLHDTKIIQRERRRGTLFLDVSSLCVYFILLVLRCHFVTILYLNPAHVQVHRKKKKKMYKNIKAERGITK